LKQNPHICLQKKLSHANGESGGLKASKGNASEDFVNLRHDNIEERELDKQVSVCMKVN